MEQGSFDQHQQLSLEDREVIEAGLSISHNYDVDIQSVGVLAPSLREEQLAGTPEIHLIVYGQVNAKKIVHASFRLPAEGSRLRSLMKIEVFSEAERIAMTTGQPLEDCFHMLYHRYDHFFLRNRAMRLSFVPSVADIAQYMPYDEKSIFTSTGISVKITATISEDAWGSFYPYCYDITDVNINEQKISSGSPDIPPTPLIRRILILDHEVFGFFHIGDRIEAMGSLQLCENLPYSTTTSPEPTYQVILGGPESYEGEYVLPKTEGEE